MSQFEDSLEYPKQTVCFKFVNNLRTLKSAINRIIYDDDYRKLFLNISYKEFPKIEETTMDFCANGENLSYLPLYVFSGKTSLSGPPLHCLGMSRHFELMYNMGIQLLHCGKALPAFECLIEAVQMFQINPHLWLRLAECCIMAYREVGGVYLNKPFVY